MINLKKILCPVDLSVASMLALRSANAVAGRYGATLTIIHVLENPHFDIPGGETGTFSFGELVELYREERKEEILDVLRHKGAVTVQFDILFKEGVPYDEITKTAREINSDMIIMSTCTKAHGLLAGCTTERVVRLAPCPVLSVQTNKEGVKALNDIMDTDPNAK
ncbi:MAG: universal stress protein, partial [Halobacteria archaeon]